MTKRKLQMNSIIPPPRVVSVLHGVMDYALHTNYAIIIVNYCLKILFKERKKKRLLPYMLNVGCFGLLSHEPN